MSVTDLINFLFGPELQNYLCVKKTVDSLNGGITAAFMAWENLVMIVDYISHYQSLQIIEFMWSTLVEYNYVYVILISICNIDHNVNKTVGKLLHAT